MSVEVDRLMRESGAHFTPDDLHHLERWRRLNDRQKQALLEVAEMFEEKETRQGLAEIIRQQAKISRILTIGESVGWIGALIVRLAGIVTAIGVLVGAWLFIIGRG